jgi:hypothetical protein
MDAKRSAFEVALCEWVPPVQVTALAVTALVQSVAENGSPEW